MVLTEMERHISQEDDISINERRRSLILLDALPERLKCPLCSKIFKDPIQTIRGELACQDCYVTKQKNGMCPIDNQPISTGQWFTDKFKAMEVSNLQCHCINKDNGCQWVGKVSEVEGHYKDCLYEPEKCLICRKTLNDGESQEEHLKRCERFHRDRKCPFQQYGCNFQLSENDDVLLHLKSHDWKHSLMQFQTIKKLQGDVMSTQNEVATLSQERNNEKQVMQKKIDLLEKQLTCAVDSLHKMEELMTTLQKQVETFASQKTSSKGNTANDTEFKSLNNSVKNFDTKISEIELAQQLFENSSFDGKMIWKVDNFNYRMQQAVTGEVTALHSAPCFTSKYGYKFCGRLYLNGDGMGKCTHLSLFIVLMKSEYDNLLEWPFTKRVTLRVINQEDSMKSMEESFVGDRFSSSFQKPSRELNVASGCPLLVPKDELINGGFVKDDCMFIEMSVL